MTETNTGATPFFVDAGSYSPLPDELESSDPLHFPGYAAELDRAREQTGASESLSVGRATIGGAEIIAAQFEFGFLGGSLGTVAGERLARGLEHAAVGRLPFVLRTATGGARMQEGMAALVQMPKLVAARQALADAGSPLLAILGHPTTGGVLASIAALADVTFGEAGATIGFAGPRLVEQISGKGLRAESHTAEGAAQAGLIDAVVQRDKLHSALAEVLEILKPDTADDTGPPPPLLRADGLPNDTEDVWAIYQQARASNRPRSDALLAGLGPHFVLRGDRAGRDDPAVIAALVRVTGWRALLLALNRAQPGPGAYRKARRAVAIATRLSLPIITVIDTPGADPLEDSEAGGIAWEIAALFDSVLSAPVPVLAIVTGEGGSGGALAFACGDVLVAYRGSVFSVIGPELAAQILWRDPNRAEEAARLQRPTAGDLVSLGIADALVDADLDENSLRTVIAYHLDLLNRDDPATRISRRRDRWRR